MVTLLLLLATAAGPQLHTQPFATMALCSAAAERAAKTGVAGQAVLRAECAKE